MPKVIVVAEPKLQTRPTPAEGTPFMLGCDVLGMSGYVEEIDEPAAEPDVEAVVDDEPAEEPKMFFVCPHCGSGLGERCKETCKYIITYTNRSVTIEERPVERA
jgi:hypothetical protein